GGAGGAVEHGCGGGREGAEKPRRVLIAAVLRPEQREHRQLEVVGGTPEQLPDSPELPVGETARAMEWLLCDGAQESSLAGAGGRPAARLTRGVARSLQHRA